MTAPAAPTNLRIVYEGQDITAPTLSVPVATPTSNSVTITWTSNEASDSQVVYGATAYYGSSSTLDATMVTNHSVTVSSLSASTTYHYRVKSRDAAGNLAVSGDYSFETEGPAGDVDVPFTIQEALPSGVSGLARTSEPVTVGIPLLDSWNVTSVNQLGLSGATVGQFKALGYWPSNNLRWVLVDTQATMTAGGTASVTLTTGSGNFGGGNLASLAGGTITVATGTATFTIKAGSGFNIFDTLSVGGTTLVSTGNAGGVVMRDSANTVYSSVNDTSATATIEENGPVRCCIKCMGACKTAGGTRLMDYTLRLHFYKGKSYVKANFTIRNADKDYLSAVLFNNVELIVPMTLGATKSFVLAEKSGIAADSLGAGEMAYLIQGYNNSANLSDDGSLMWYTPPIPATGTIYTGFTPIAANQGLKIARGATVYNTEGTADDWTQGYGELKDSTGKGVTCALRYMHTYWPAGFEFKGDGQSSIEMYSKYNVKTGIKMTIPRHEGREVMWDFHSAAITNSDVATRLNYPLVARATLQHYMDAEAWFGQSELVTVAEKANFFTNLGLGSPSYPYTIANPTLAIHRTSKWGSGGSPQQQIDQAAAWWLLWIRSGYGGYFLNGEAKAHYYTSNSVYHADNWVRYSASPYNTDIMYGDSSGDYGCCGGYQDGSHSHVYSVIFAYWLTGNEEFREGYLKLVEQVIQSWTTVGGFSGQYWSYSESRPPLTLLRNMALAYEFSVILGIPVAALKTYVESALDQLVAMWGLPADASGLSVQGNNLQRGYLYIDAAVSSRGDYLRKVVHTLYSTSYLEEAFYQVLRMLDDWWTYADVQKLRDIFYGHALYIMEEGVDYVSGRQRLYYDLALDTAPVGDNSYDWPIHRHALTAYEKTGNTKYLADGAKSEFYMQDISDYTAYTEQPYDQMLMSRYLNPPPFWTPISVSPASCAGVTSQLLTWTSPANATDQEIRYAATKQIVEWLGFNKNTRAYELSPATYQPYFASFIVPSVPAVNAGVQQTVTVSGLNAGNTYYFFAKAKVPKTAYSEIADNSWLNVNNGQTLAPGVNRLAYGGFALDTTHNKIILFGGGHNDAWDNSVWTFNLVTKTWSQDYASDYSTAIRDDYTTGHALALDHTNLATYPGAWLDDDDSPTVIRPVSRHTYGSNVWLPNVGKMITAGGALNYDSGPNWEDCWPVSAGKDYVSWMYDPMAKTWTYGAAWTGPLFWHAAYGSSSQLLYVPQISIFGVVIKTFNGASTWATLSTTGAPAITSVTASPICYDSSRNCLYVLFWVPGASVFYKLDLTQSPAAWTQLSITNGPTQNSLTNIEYDSHNDVVVAMIPSGSAAPVIKVYSPSGDSWSTPTPPASKPGDGLTSEGAYWRYDRNNNLFWYVRSNNYYTDLWAYRYAN